MTRTALVRTDRYSWSAIWLHWSIAVLVLVNPGLGEAGA
jgi:cytochrome b561